MPLSQFVLSPADVILQMTHRNAANIAALVEQGLRERRKEFRKVINRYDYCHRTLWMDRSEFLEHEDSGIMDRELSR